MFSPIASPVFSPTRSPVANGLFGGMSAVIRALFANSEQGIWLDASDFSTMYQDSAGTTPVTAVGQPVGLMLDKSKGLVLGSEQVTNGDFSSSTGWGVNTGWTIANGKATKNGGATTNINRTDCSFVVGRTYRVTVVVTDFVSGRVRVELPGVQFYEFIPSGTGGTYTAHITPTSSASTLYIYDGSAAFSGSIDNISIRELPGAHATQSTAASRPVLMGENPILGETVLADDFSNGVANWTKGGDGAFAASGGKGVLTWGTTSATSVTRAFATVIGQRYAFTFDFEEQIDGGSISVRVGTAALGAQNAGSTDYIGNPASVVKSYEFTATATTTYVSFLLALGGVWAFDNISVREVTAFQNYYLSFDGIDDFLVTPSIDFSLTDKMTVFAGVRKLSDAAAAFAFGTADATATLGSFSVYSPAGTGASIWNEIRATGDSGAAANVRGSAISAPASFVLSGAIDLAATPEITGRENGSPMSAQLLDAGGGMFANRPLHIGRRGGTSLPFNGRLYSLIVRGGKLGTGANLAVNGDMSSAAGWTLGSWSMAGGVASAVSLVSDGTTGLRQTVTLETGKTYTVTADVTSITAGAIGLSFVTPATATGTSAAFTSRTTVGPLERTFTCTAGGTFTVGFGSNATTFTGSVDNLQIREIRQVGSTAAEIEAAERHVNAKTGAY